MRRLRLCISLVVACLAFAAVSLIKADKSNKEHLANLVCKTTSGSINHLTNLASVNGVIDYLNGLASGHKLESCRDKYLESLQQLVRVVEAASNDVCGDEKLKLLEDYHRRYISKISKHEKERRKHRNKAPKLAKLFFMQYAIEVSSICLRAALESLANYEPSDDKLAKMEKLRRFTNNLGMTEFSKGYKGIYLFWNMVDALNLDKRDRFAKYLTQSGGIRINLQVKKAESLVELQAYCRHQLKPFYSKSLLPVLRLVDMGYHPASDALLRSDGHARDLLYATQICETMLPVGIYQNDNLNAKEVVVLTKDEANQMSPYAPQNSTEHHSEPTIVKTPSSLNSEELNFLDTNCEGVKANVDYHGKIVGRMLRKMVKRLRGITSVIRGFKLLYRNRNSQKLEEFDGNDLEKITEESLQLYEKPTSGLVRRKRELIIALLFCGLVVAFIAVCLLILYYGGDDKEQENKKPPFPFSLFWTP